MTTVKPEDLRKAYKKEKDPRVARRMLAVNMVCINGESIQVAADFLMQCPNWVRMGRVLQGGRIDTLCDLPRSGKPPKVNSDKIVQILADVNNNTTPKKLKNDIQTKLGVTYHIPISEEECTNLGYLPRRFIVSTSTGQTSMRLEDGNAKSRISRLELKGFVAVVFDESIFIHVNPFYTFLAFSYVRTWLSLENGSNQKMADIYPYEACPQCYLHPS